MKVMDYFYVSHGILKCCFLEKENKNQNSFLSGLNLGLTHGSILPALPSLGHRVTTAVKVTRGITTPPIHFIPAAQWDVSQLPCAEHNSEIALTINPSNILLHSS